MKEEKNTTNIYINNKVTSKNFSIYRVFNVFKYKIIYIYFKGGPLSWSGIYKYFEPFFLQIS